MHHAVIGQYRCITIAIEGSLRSSPAVPELAIFHAPSSEKNYYGSMGCLDRQIKTRQLNLMHARLWR